MTLDHALKKIRELGPYDGHEIKTRSETEWLWTTCQSLPRQARVLEIGSHRGRSACLIAMAANGKKAEIWSLEPDISLWNKATQLRHALGINSNRVNFINGASPSDIPGGQWDFAFIDGDHKIMSVAVDIAAAIFPLKKGGILAGHDWQTQRVRATITGLLEYNDLVSNVETAGRIWWTRKIMETPY